MLFYVALACRHFVEPFQNRQLRIESRPVLLDEALDATDRRRRDPHAQALDDLDRALEAAEKGFQVWRKVSAHERGAIMRRAAALLKERADEIAAPFADQEKSAVIALGRGQMSVIIPLLNITPLFDAEGRLIYFLGVQFDVTEQLRAENEIGDLRASLQSIG